MGVREALRKGTDYVLTINDDVEVEPDFLTHLVRCAQEISNSIVGSKILYNTHRNRIWQCGAFFHPVFGQVGYGRDQLDCAELSYRKEVDILTGMSVLIPAHVFRKIGFYDEKHLPMMYGDTDFILRASKAGYKIVVEPRSRVYNNDLHSGYREEANAIRFLYNSLFSKHAREGGIGIQRTWRFYRRHSSPFLFVFPVLKEYLFFAMNVLGRIILGKDMARKIKGTVKRSLRYLVGLKS